MDISFSPNFTHIYDIDITPSAATPTKARLGAGLKTIEPDPSENVSEDEYYDGDGLGSADVTGAKWKVSFSGDRDYNDPAQNYIASLKFSYGAARRTHLYITCPDGERIEGNATIANIKTFGGDANSKAAISFDVYFNGLPKWTPPTSAILPEAVTATDVNVIVGGTATVTPTVTPSEASKYCVYAVDNTSIATVDAEGTVKGITEGETELTVKCAAKPSVLKTIKVSVTSGARAQTAKS